MTHYSNLDHFHEQEFRRETKAPVISLAALLFVFFFFLTLLISKLDKVAEIEARFLGRPR